MLAYLKARFSYYLDQGISFFIPFIIQRALKTKLNAIWAKGNWSDLPKDGFIFAVNHHSWWDVYLALLMHKQLKRKISAIMDDTQLNTFKFFRNLGAVGRKEIREAIKRLKQGHMFFIFPEGDLQQNGTVKHLERGVTFLAKTSNTSIYPLVFKVVMRGAQHPEAFILLGEKLELSHDEETDLLALKNALNDLLSQVDSTLATTHPEKAPEEFERWLAGQASVSERMSWLGRLWS